MSKENDIRNKIKGARDPRRNLMGGASTTEENNINNNVNENINNNVNVNVDINDNQNFLNDLVSGKAKKKADTLINSGVYFEPEVYSILMTLAKRGGRGAKSKIVNDALKAAFKNAGLMD